MAFSLTSLVPGLETAKWVAGIALVLGVSAGCYYKGHADEESAFNLYKQEQAAAAEKQAADSQAKAKTAEEAAATAQATIDAQRLQDEATNDQRKNDTIAALRNGSLRLSNELASTRKQLGVSQAAASASGPATPAGQLPGDTAQFLVSESARADAVTIRYNEALAVIAEDRKTCSGDAP